MSMVSHMHETDSMPKEVRFLYSTKVRSAHDVSNVLCLPALLRLCSLRRGQFHLSTFLGGHPSRALMEAAEPRDRFEPRLLLDGDVIGAFAKAEPNSTVCYACGPSEMTDHIASLAQNSVGLDRANILSETVTEEGSAIGTGTR